MCSVADMWGATACLQKCISALSQLKKGEMGVAELAEICLWLPDTLPSYPQWEEQLLSHVLVPFQDVHTLLTTYELLQRFRELPFECIRAWAASDKLVVDSENSVAVAISWWYEGEVGSEASEEELKELSGLLRVAHLSTGETAKSNRMAASQTCMFVYFTDLHDFQVLPAQAMQ
jgi:hypothetical protein